MVRDYERVARQIESVISELNKAIENNQVISIGNACRNAHIHEAWLYRVLNNIEDYKISDELLERLEYARDGVISVIIQRLDVIAHGEEDKDSLECVNETSLDESSNNSKSKDSGNRIARDTLRLKHEQWKYKCLLPKHFNDGQSNTSVLVATDNRQFNVIIKDMTLDQMRALASIKMIDKSNHDE